MKEKISIIYEENKTEFLLLFFIIFIFAISPLFTRYFLKFSNLMNLSRQSANLVIVSLGMFVVILSGGIDLSVGGIMQISGMTGMVIATAGIPVWTIPLILLILGGGIGLINGIVTIYGRLQPFIVTLATGAIMNGIVLTYTKGHSLAPRNIDSAFRTLGAGYLGFIPNPTIVMVLIGLIFWILMSKTTYGRYVYVKGSSKIAATYSGVKSKKIGVSVYVLSGFCAAIAGFLTTSRVGSFQPATVHNGGSAIEIIAIASVVIGGARLKGGTGSVFGTILGGFISAILLNFLVLLGLNIWSQRFIVAVIIMIMALYTAKEETWNIKNLLMNIIKTPRKLSSGKTVEESD